MSPGVTCPKCGLMQLAGPSCKSCGAPLGGPPRGAVPPGVAAGSPPPPAGGEAAVYRLTFHGTGGSLFGIHIVNTFLTIVTLGIYHFWGKVKVRRYLFGQTEFAGDRFAFHGTGRELCLGTLKAVGVFLLPIALLGYLPGLLGLPGWVDLLAGLLGYLLFMTFLPVAMVGARRYRLSRTSWRGIRFGFRGELWAFVKLFWAGGLLSAVTFGLYYPFFEMRRQAFLVQNSRFGTQRFDFDGAGRELVWSFLLTTLLLPVTFGLSWIWYLAKKRRCFWEHTHVGEASFRFPITGGKLLWLYAVDLLLLLSTLGLAWPWVVVRNSRFTCRHLRLVGRLDLESILQEAGEASSVGEGLAGFLDADLGLGV